MGSGAIYLPILGIFAGALLFFGILPPGNLGGEIRQLIPELIGQRPLVHVDRDSIGFAAAILHGGGVGHGIGEVHRFAAARCQGFNAVCGNDRSQLRHIRAAGHGDGDGIGGIVHRTGHTVDGEGRNAVDGGAGGLPIAGDADVTAGHLEAVSGDRLVLSAGCGERVPQGPRLHLIARLGRDGDDDLVALVGPGAVGGDGAAGGRRVHRDRKVALIRRFGAAVGGDLDLEGIALHVGKALDHDVDIPRAGGQVGQGDGVLTLDRCRAALGGVHRGSRRALFHHLVEVVARHAGGKLHGGGVVAGALHRDLGQDGRGGHIGLGDGDGVLPGQAVDAGHDELRFAAGADGAHDLAGGPGVLLSGVVVAGSVGGGHLLQGLTGVLDLHEDRVACADLGQQIRVDAVGQGDGPLAAGKLAGGDGLGAVQQRHGGDLRLGVDHDLVGGAGLAVLRDNGEHLRLAQRRDAAGLTILAPLGIALLDDRVCRVAADELQAQVGQVRDGHAGGQLDGVGVAGLVGAGQPILAVSGPQLHAQQGAVVVGLGRIDHEVCRGGDVLAGAGHGEGDLTVILGDLRRLRGLSGSRIARITGIAGGSRVRLGFRRFRSDRRDRDGRAAAVRHRPGIRFVQLIPLALGGGGQGDGLTLEHHGFALHGVAAAHRDGSAAHGGGAGLGGHGGEDLRPELRRDLDVVPRQFDAGVAANIIVCHILRVIRAVNIVDHDLPAEKHPGFLPVTITVETHIGRTSSTVHILGIAHVAVDRDRRGPIGGGAPCDRGADVFKFREKRDIRIRHLEGHRIRLALFLGQFDAGLVLPLHKGKLVHRAFTIRLRHRRNGLALEGAGYGGPALIGEDNIALPVSVLVALVFPNQRCGGGQRMGNGKFRNIKAYRHIVQSFALGQNVKLLGPSRQAGKLDRVGVAPQRCGLGRFVKRGFLVGLCHSVVIGARDIGLYIDGGRILRRAVHGNAFQLDLRWLFLLQIRSIFNGKIISVLCPIRGGKADYVAPYTCSTASRHSTSHRLSTDCRVLGNQVTVCQCIYRCHYCSTLS